MDGSKAIESKKAPAEPSPARHRVIMTLRSMSDVVDERLDAQYSLLMEVAESIAEAKEVWSRCGFVCGVEIGKQTAAHEANVLLHSLLKCGAETLREIANRIDPPAISRHGEDSMDIVYEPLDAQEEVAHARN